jgi:ABC-type histidine transport system ATPase subunit
MAAGEILEVGLPGAVLAAPKNNRLRTFLGRFHAVHRR